MSFLCFPNVLRQTHSTIRIQMQASRGCKECFVCTLFAMRAKALSQNAITSWVVLASLPSSKPRSPRLEDPHGSAALLLWSLKLKEELREAPQGPNHRAQSYSLAKDHQKTISSTLISHTLWMAQRLTSPEVDHVRQTDQVGVGRKIKAPALMNPLRQAISHPGHPPVRFHMPQAQRGTGWLRAAIAQGCFHDCRVSDSPREGPHEEVSLGSS